MTVQIDVVLLEAQLSGVLDFFPAALIDGSVDQNRTDRSDFASVDAHLDSILA